MRPITLWLRARDHLLGLQDDAGLVEGRARDQRHHGRRRPAAAARSSVSPTPSTPRPRPAGSAPSSGPTAPGPRSMVARATCPPRSRPTWRCGWPATRRTQPHMRQAAEFVRDQGGLERQPGVHPDLAGPVRPVVLGRPARHAARADLPARAGSRSTSTTGAAGPGRPSSPLTVCQLPAPVPAAAVRPGRAAGPAARAGTAGAVGPGRWCSTGWTRRARATTAARLATGRGRPGRGPCGGPRCAAAADWIIARQEADGCWGGIQPPWVYSLIGAAPARLPAGPPGHRQRAWPAWTGSRSGQTTPDGLVRRLEACQSPVWDTVLVMVGAWPTRGCPPTTRPWPGPAALAARRGGPGPGDWQVRRPGLEPGGWAFEFDNDVLPRHRRHRRGRPGPAPGRAARARRPGPAGHRPRASAGWSACSPRTAAWGAFDADNTRELVNKLPFCDFGEVIDPPSADVTAHVVEALAAEGLAGCQAARRGVAWLLRNQETGRLLVRPLGRQLHLRHRGRRARADRRRGAAVQPVIRRAVAWLEAHQNADGGWGEDLRSYANPAWVRPGHLDRLADRVGPAGPARGRGRGRRTRWTGAWRWLVDTQRAGRGLGRAAVHRHRLPRRLLHQLPPVPAGLPDQRPRPLPARIRRARTDRAEPGADFRSIAGGT